MRHLFSIIFFILFSFVSFFAQSQVSINGPVCVRAGVEYQYIINGNWASESTTRICVSGGVITDSLSSCINGNSFSELRVTWNFNTPESIIQLTSSEGNSLLNISVSDTLRPGVIDPAFKKQTIGSNSIPNTIVCSAARGGSCSPAYKYQWQRSTDNIDWENIDGGTSKDLLFPTSLTQPTFFRRKIVEINSNSVDYSDVAAVYVNSTNEQ